MRLGQNPAKAIDHVPQPKEITVAIVTYIPFLEGYYSESLDVLKVCLNSIWENTDLPYDLMIFDNASCVDVRSYLMECHQQGRIQYLVLSDKNVGKGGAWNFIFQAAPGEIIAYADSDVLFYRGWLESSVNILKTFPNIGMVTARPMRTPESFFTSTLNWARQAEQNGELQIENQVFLAWEDYREHLVSLGTSEEQAREWYEEGKDWRLTLNSSARINEQAYPTTICAQIGAAHFQFTAFKSVLQKFLPFSMDRPMGQVRSLDELVNNAGYLRLGTCEVMVKHLGNHLEPSVQASQNSGFSLSTNRESQAGGSKRIYDIPAVKKLVLKVYDTIFKIYYH